MKGSKEKLVLLAEDDAAMRQYLEIILRREGYSVLSAKDGLEAMQIALDNKPDAIVTDAVMPNLSGYDLCRVIKSIPHLRDLLFVMLSGMEPEKSDSFSETISYVSKDSSLKNNLIEKLANGLPAAAVDSCSLHKDYKVAGDYA